jgi:hypothetical protein
MQTDKFGQIILSEVDVCSLYLKDPDFAIRNCFVDTGIHFDPDLELSSIPHLIEYSPSSMTLEEFDNQNKINWKMPDEYKNLDIVKYILDLCQTDEERQRVGEELLLYVDRDLLPLLQFLKYLVDTMRKYNIVWGVGRGSSVSSYVLYLLGVHKINSMYYGLDIHDFLR